MSKRKLRGESKTEKHLRSLRMIFFMDYDDGQGGHYVNSPGLLPLVGITRKNGFEVNFVSSEEKLLRLITCSSVDLVGISSMERLLPSSISVAKKVRLLRPDIIIMIGGNALDSFAIELAAGLFDIVALGECEHTLTAILDALACARGLFAGLKAKDTTDFIDGPIRKIADSDCEGALDQLCIDALKKASFTRSIGPSHEIAIRISNTYFKDPISQAVWCLDEPNKGSLDGLGRLSDLAHQREKSLNVSLSTTPLASELDDMCLMPWDIFELEGWSCFEFYTQRGCRWGKCRFCTVAGRQVRALDPKTVFEVIKSAVDHGAGQISFADDLFIHNKSWTRQLLQLLGEHWLPVRFRAQTLPDKTIWPFLEDMRKVGFNELAFGVETLSSERARWLGKSHNGHKFVEYAIETVRRTAKAGIQPVLYMIMVDPTSNLLSIAAELETVTEVLISIYKDTGVLPKLSHSLTLLPVAGSEITAQSKCAIERIPLGKGRSISFPTEIQFSGEISKMLKIIIGQSEVIVYPRENLSSLGSYIAAVETVAGDFYNGQELTAIIRYLNNASQLYNDLITELNKDIDNMAQTLLSHYRHGTSSNLSMNREFSFERFGGYRDGIHRLSRLLQDQLSADELTVKSASSD